MQYMSCVSSIVCLPEQKTLMDSTFMAQSSSSVRSGWGDFYLVFSNTLFSIEFFSLRQISSAMTSLRIHCVWSDMSDYLDWGHMLSENWMEPGGTQYRENSQSCRIHKGDFIKDRTGIRGGCYMCVSAGWLHSAHWKFHYVVFTTCCMCKRVCSSLSARLHSLMCTVDVQVSVRLDVLLIVCQAKTSFKSLSRELHMEHWCRSVRSRGGETDGRKIKGGREGEGEGDRTRRPFLWLFCLCH